MAKSSVAQRESAGVVVPVIGLHQHAPGGTGPCAGHACAPGTGAGMVRTAGAHYPTGISPSDHGRRPERTLSLAAEPPPIAAVACSHHDRRDVRWETGRSRPALSHMPQVQTIGTPDAGTSHVRFERGSVETGRIAAPRH
ncbi:MAG TPA: hypothetical protein DCP25_01555 [Chloroflexi bacterium]|nr:hypothetical protein [Chloroflexota bacterium]